MSSWRSSGLITTLVRTPADEAANVIAAAGALGGDRDLPRVVMTLNRPW
jgi:hypothetical protein